MKLLETTLDAYSQLERSKMTIDFYVKRGIYKFPTKGITESDVLTDWLKSWGWKLILDAQKGIIPYYKLEKL